MPISTFRVINLILFLVLILSSCEQEPLMVEDENLSLSSDTITFNIVDDITYQIPPNMSGSKHLYIGKRDNYEFDINYIRINKFSVNRYDPFNGDTIVSEFHNYSTSSLTVDSLKLSLNFINDSIDTDAQFYLRYFPDAPDSVFSRSRTNYLNNNTNYSDIISYGTILEDTSSSYATLSFSIDPSYFSEFIDTSLADFNNSFLIGANNAEQGFYEFFSMNSGENTSPSLSIFFKYILNDSTIIDTFNVHSATEDLAILKPPSLAENDTSYLSVSLAKGLKSLFAIDTKEWQLPKGSVIRKAELLLSSVDNDSSNSSIINSYPLKGDLFPKKFSFFENDPFDLDIPNGSSSAMNNNQLKLNHRLGSTNFFNTNKSLHIFNIQPNITNDPFTTINFHNSNHIELFPKFRIIYVIP